MFKKILIAEDHEIENSGVINALKEMQVQDFEFVGYCDDALRKLADAVHNGLPYDLLITDLSFDVDHIRQYISSGQDLIREARALQPLLKIIVFSTEKRPMIIDELFKTYQVDGFVSKARNDGKELKNTMRKIYKNEIVIPQELLNSIRNYSIDFTEYDTNLLKLLSLGLSQSEIEGRLKKDNIQPYSKSSIEKRLNELRDNLCAKNNIEMIVLCKDLGII